MSPALTHLRGRVAALASWRGFAIAEIAFVALCLSMVSRLDAPWLSLALLALTAPIAAVLAQGRTAEGLRARGVPLPLLPLGSRMRAQVESVAFVLPTALLSALGLAAICVGGAAWSRWLLLITGLHVVLVAWSLARAGEGWMRWTAVALALAGLAAGNALDPAVDLQAGLWLRGGLLVVVLAAGPEGLRSFAVSFRIPPDLVARSRRPLPPARAWHRDVWRLDGIVAVPLLHAGLCLGVTALANDPVHFLRIGAAFLLVLATGTPSALTAVGKANGDGLRLWRLLPLRPERVLLGGFAHATWIGASKALMFAAVLTAGASADGSSAAGSARYVAWVFLAPCAGALVVSGAVGWEERRLAFGLVLAQTCLLAVLLHPLLRDRMGLPAEAVWLLPLVPAAASAALAAHRIRQAAALA